MEKRVHSSKLHYNDSIMEKLIKNLITRRFDAHFCATKEEAVALALSMVHEGAVVGYGGSVTLNETGMLEALRKAPCKLLDRDRASTPEERERCLLQGPNADVFFASVNAIDESGVIYQTEGRGSRVAPIMFGAKKVVLLVGKNKIVKDKEAAEKRLREIACPRNAARLNRKTPCRETGVCMDCIALECICANRVEMRLSAVPNRIAVLLIDEELGY